MIYSKTEIERGCLEAKSVCILEIFMVLLTFWFKDVEVVKTNVDTLITLALGGRIVFENTLF